MALWLPARELFAGDVTSSERFEGERFSSAEDQHPARQDRDVMFARTRAMLRANC
jgi:hypothetical protein